MGRYSFSFDQGKALLETMRLEGPLHQILADACPTKSGTPSWPTGPATRRGPKILQMTDCLPKNFAAMLVIAELIEARTSWRKQNDIARLGAMRRFFHGLHQRVHQSAMRKQTPRSTKLFARLAD